MIRRIRYIGCHVVALFLLSGVVKAADDRGLPQIASSASGPNPSVTSASRAAQDSGASYILAGNDAAGQPSADVWILPLGAKIWQHAALNEPLAWPAVAGTNNGIIVIGGMDARGVSSRVFRLHWNGSKLDEEEMPSLPQGRMGAGATVLNGVLYVFGGLSSPDEKVPLNSFIAFDLVHPDGAWRELAALPAEGRVAPFLVAQYGEVFILGGKVQSGDGYASTAETWAYLPTIVDGTMRQGWERRASLPWPATVAPAAALGQAEVMVAASHGDLEESSSPWPSVEPLSAEMLLYHAVTDAWTQAGAGVAGTPLAILTTPGTEVFMVPTAGSSSSTQLQLLRNVRTLGWLDYVVIALYFVLLVGIGGYFSRKQNSSNEFSLGSRKVVWWAAGISMFATGASAISFMAIPALAFCTSLIWATPLLVYIPAYYIQAHLIFPLLRRMELTSTYEYLERRFNLALRLIASAQCIVLQTFGRASIVLVLPSIAISAVTGVNLYLSVVLMGIITTIYTALGGFEAVIWTAVFQGVLKLIAPLVMIYLAIAYLPGGFHQFWQIGIADHKFDLVLPSWDPKYPVFFGLVLSTLMAATVQIAGDQPIIQRVFSAPMNEVRRVSAMSVVCSIVIGIIVNVMGIAIYAYFKVYPAKFDPLASNDQIVPLYTVQALPMGMAGVVVAAIFASAMATVASSMNSVATIFTEDFYLRWRPRTSDKARLRWLKGISYLVGTIATVMALLLASLNLTSLMAVWSQLMTLLGGGVVGVYSLGMFTRRANSAGAIIGAIASIIISLCVKLFTPIHWSLYAPVAILSCMLIGYFASLPFGPSRRDLTGLTVFTPTADRPEPSAPVAVPVA